MIKRFVLCFCIGALLSLAACQPHVDEISRGFEAMDTYMNITLYDNAEAAEEIEAAVMELDARLSVTNADGADNEIYRVNQNGGGEVSSDTAALAQQALALCGDTGGALDITVCPLVEEWGFLSGDYHIPSEERLAELLPLVDYRQVTCGDGHIRLNRKGMKLDFGAVAKGYAADRGVATLRQKGVNSALLNFGGTIAACGKKPDGSRWKIGIADPDNSASYMGYLPCENRIIATSGSYERCFEGEDGKRYSHLLDPKTGVPADNGFTSVTIVSDNGLRSDGLSTALFVMGLDKARAYYESRKDFDCILLTADKKAYVTPGVKESFQVADGYDYEVIPL